MGDELQPRAKHAWKVVVSVEEDGKRISDTVVVRADLVDVKHCGALVFGTYFTDRDECIIRDKVTRVFAPGVWLALEALS